MNNNLKVLLISDPTTSKSGASLSVAVGSSKDDEDALGLAHLCEHMLFMGSKAYPELNGLMDLVNNYNGYINAYTDNELTNYYFEIGNGGFDSAIDMFAKMFAEPLFDPNAIEKEIINVNSENEKNINNNHWKMSQILKTFAKEEHPYSRFHTGNKDTLDIHSPETLTKKLKQFFKTYYYAENMKLVVLCKIYF